MKTPAAPPRLALGPLLLAIALGSAGFASGWWIRSGAADIPAAAHPSQDEHRAPAARRPLSHTTTQPTHGGPDATRASPSGPSQAEAAARLTAWVAAGCPGGHPREITELLAAWSRVDLWAALAFVHGAPQFRGRTQAYRIPLGLIGKERPSAVLEWLARELPDTGIRQPVTDSVIRQLMDDAPGAAVEIARTGAPTHSYLFSQAYSNLALHDPGAAVAWFDRFSETERTACARGLAEGWLIADRQAASTWCLAQSGQPHGEAVIQALSQHLAVNAPDELAALFARPDVPMSARMIAVHRLGSTRPELALDLIPALPQAEARTAFASMFDSLFSEDPAAAIQLGRSMLTREALANHVSEEWRKWAASDQPAALAWAGTVPDPYIRAQLALAIRVQQVQRDPAAYLATQSQTAADDGTVDMINLALRALTYRDPVEAARWCSIHARTTTPDRAGSISGMLFERDPSQAVAWARSLPSGAARDAAQAALVEAGSGHKDAARFVGLIEQIGDPVLQTRTRYRVYRAMHERDPATAETWLASQPLPAEVRTSWMALVETDEPPVVYCGTRPSS